MNDHHPQPEPALLVDARHLVVLYRCSNHFVVGGWGDIHHCPVLQPRPGGECWSCRQPECLTWMSKYGERDC